MRVEMRTSWAPGACASCGEPKGSLIVATARDAATGRPASHAVCEACLTAAHALVAAFEAWREGGTKS
jgi:hypothetical protein